MGLTVGLTVGMPVGVTECVIESVTEAVFALEDGMMKKKAGRAQRLEFEVDNGF